MNIFAEIIKDTVKECKKIYNFKPGTSIRETKKDEPKSVEDLLYILESKYSTIEEKQHANKMIKGRL